MKIKSVDDLRLWASLGSCRIASLAKIIGCKDKYLYNLCYEYKESVPDNMLSIIDDAVCSVEEYEMRKPNKVEKNILLAARKTNHRDDYIRKIATEALDRWVMILSRNYGAMQ